MFDFVASGMAGVLVPMQRATHATLLALAGELAGFELSGSDTNVLAVLADGTARTVGRLAEETGTRPSTLTSVLDRLVRRGLVVRELDPADRRSFVVALTGEGGAVAAAVDRAVRRIEGAALARVSAAEVAGFHAVLDALVLDARVPDARVPDAPGEAAR
jgi:MarR family transcriptional regulator, organic hydroperoxide resistance regulator